MGFENNIYDDVPFFRPLCHKGQLKSMINYVYANADRAWQRKQNPELFRLHRQIVVCGLTFTSLGNHFLLDWPDRQLIEVSRNATEEQVQSQLQTALSLARYGVVTYTAAISKGEQLIARTIREQDFPLVVLLSDGFPNKIRLTKNTLSRAALILRLVPMEDCCFWNLLNIHFCRNLYKKQPRFHFVKRRMLNI